MHGIAHTPVKTRTPGTPSRRRLALAVLALVLAAGLVAVGRWTAPTGSTAAPHAVPVTEACGVVSPAATPSTACRGVLERVYLGPNEEACGTIAPAAVPAPGCQRVLERVFLGAARSS